MLAGTGLAVTSAGCVGRVRNIMGRDRSAQLSLEIRTVPADADPNAIRIARHLSEHLNAVGVDARVDTMAQADLSRSVLLNHDFDVYVGQFPRTKPFDADALYPLLHSRFTAETGWQNPFGFTELVVDDLLEDQRRANDERRAEVIADLQEAVCELQPFTVVAFPDALTAYREGTFSGWGTSYPNSAQGLLKLSHVREEETTDDDDPVTLRLTTTDDRITENWNPIAAEYRQHGAFTSLLYDPLARPSDDGPIPWLARAWEWSDPRTLRVEIRDAEWHDGEPLTAADVAFTYEFLRDTSMGEAETPIPTPRFRGRSSLVESVGVIDRSTVEIRMENVNPGVGELALQVPVLPEHVWSEYTDPVSIAGLAVDEETTEALVWNNEEPVGSGPLRFVESTAESEVTFERNPSHFLRRPEALESVDEGETEDGNGIDEEGGSDGTDADEDDADDAGVDGAEDNGSGATDEDENGTGDDGDSDGDNGDSDGDNGDSDGDNGDSDDDGSDAVRSIPEAFHGKPSFERLVLEVVPSDIAAVQLVGDGMADATASNLGPDAVPRIGREADARLVSSRSAAFYHVGYNARRAPLSNPRFRAVLASLIDKSALVDDAFQGYARAAASPMAASSETVPDWLRWDDETDEDPVYPFQGSDGDLDVDAVRDAFREAGYRYNEAGELLSRDQ